MHLAQQGLFRDPEMLGLAAAAVQFHDGQLPLAALPHSRALRGWAKEYGAEHLRQRRRRHHDQQQQQPGGSSGAGAEAVSAAAGEADALVAAGDPAVLVELVREELMQQQQQQDLGLAQGQRQEQQVGASVRCCCSGL